MRSSASPSVELGLHEIVYGWPAVSVSPVGATDSQRPAWGSSTYLAYEVVDPSTNLAAIAVMSRQSGSTPCVLLAAGSDNRNPTWSPQKKDQ